MCVQKEEKKFGWVIIGYLIYIGYPLKIFPIKI